MVDNARSDEDSDKSRARADGAYLVQTTFLRIWNVQV